jgi:hypothetical protein
MIPYGFGGYQFQIRCWPVAAGLWSKRCGFAKTQWIFPGTAHADELLNVINVINASKGVTRLTYPKKPCHILCPLVWRDPPTRAI